MCGEIFHEEDIWKLLDCTVGAYKFLQENEICCGNISANNIYCVLCPCKMVIFKVSDSLVGFSPSLNIH
jgi:hypothetical protein